MEQPNTQDSLNSQIKATLRDKLKLLLKGRFDYYDDNNAEPLLAPEVKQAWLQRLRQPGIQQTKGELRRDSSQDGSTVTSAFCCLGLLCEIAAEEGVIKADEPFTNLLGDLDTADEPITETCVFYEDDNELPPSRVSAWAIAGTRNADFILSLYSKLAHANDSGLPFPDIADVIEEVL